MRRVISRQRWRRDIQRESEQAVQDWPIICNLFDAMIRYKVRGCGFNHSRWLALIHFVALILRFLQLVASMTPMTARCCRYIDYTFSRT